MKYNPFDAPVPGQSLTDTPQNYPWEHSPKHTNINEAAETMFRALTDEDAAMNLLAMLKTGVPVEAITRTLIFTGFVEGKFNPDLGILLAPIAMNMIIAIAKRAGLKEIVITMNDDSPTKVAEEFLVRKKFDKIVANMKAEKQEKKTITKKESQPKVASLMDKEIEGEK
jgi:hypothetical protein|tara:strand:- start:1301 stop:1807 length:507 start_codon:yes stop_codon:yes gene_type:complete